jgi:alpha-galactosidase
MEELRIWGDMFGDKIVIGDGHTRQVEALFPKVLSLPKKSVITVGGPSGSGKSEIGSLLGTCFINANRNTYVISCDNYPHRPPRINDQRRAELYKQGGEAALVDYLGTPNEIDFSRMNQLIADFKSGASELNLRIMDCKNNCVADDNRTLDVSEIEILVLEGTWSALVEDVDVRIFLDSDFKKTLEHRKKRARDPLTPFGETVLTIEQKKLERIRDTRADIVINPEAEILSERFIGGIELTAA